MQVTQLLEVIERPLDIQPVRSGANGRGLIAFEQVLARQELLAKSRIDRIGTVVAKAAHL